MSENDSTRSPSPEPKHSSEAKPESVAAQAPSDPLKYTENEDGTRNYPAQKPVQTKDDPKASSEA